MDCPSVNRDFPSTGKERIKTHKTETAINFKRYGQRTTIVIHELSYQLGSARKGFSR